MGCLNTQNGVSQNRHLETKHHYMLLIVPLEVTPEQNYLFS